MKHDATAHAPERDHFAEAPEIDYTSQAPEASPLYGFLKILS